MLRYFRLFILFVIALAIILIAVANRDPVTVQLLPDQFNGIFQYQIDVPLFVLMIAVATGGFVLGWSWEYLREMRLRAQSRQRKRQVEELEQEVTSLKKKTGDVDDDVLALLK